MAEIFNQTFQPKLIYIYRINDEVHKGCLKTGETSYNGDKLLEYMTLQPNCAELNAAARQRIKSQTQTAGVSFELLYTEITAYQKGKNTLAVFQDHDVHEVLLRSGIEKKFFAKDIKANEWFVTDLETVKNAIRAVKEGRKSLTAAEMTEDQSPVEFRQEQAEAIEKTVKHFKKKSASNKFLWNAKMRFGKTLTALQVVKELRAKRTLILTHRPVVDESWFEEFHKIFYDCEDYTYTSKKNGEEFYNVEDFAKSGLNYICFASIQDMRGSEAVGGKFDKNQQIYDIPWDLIIIDEAHEGTQTELGKRVIDLCSKPNTKQLHLSGTPFNLLDDFTEDQTFTWDYTMEQKAKNEWDAVHQGDYNPYACLPRLNIYTYNLGRLYPEYADSELAFNFKEFFRTDEDGEFIHHDNIVQLLNLMTKSDSKSDYPYSTQEYRDNFRHSLWMVPGVKEARALSKLLQSHPVFGQFNIANVAGDGDEEEETKEAMSKVKAAIGECPEQTYSITLSCGRLTTGVSVKPWTACLMLSGSYNTAASSYMQTIFRVQTPAVIGGKQKTECYVFDFAPDRTLKVIAETAKISRKAGNTTNDDRTILGEFLNFCPIIAFDGSQMVQYDTGKLLGQLKRVYVERVVRNGFEDGYLYTNDLMKLDSIEKKEFDDLKAIIGTTKAMAKTGQIDINAQGLTDEEYAKAIGDKPPKNPGNEELKKKLAEARKQRENAISILRGISIRMPLMIYGAKLNKNLDGTEDEITIDNFTDIVDDLSWEEFMPKGVTKQLFGTFKKYYDKEIFCEAGKKIRQMARSADKLSIEDRIQRISDIFNTFRNPDKETVLTPWRVVNMHLCDCLGGWRFYDAQYKTMREMPEFVSHSDVTENVFKRDSRILEINSKSGLYALYAAYSIYRMRAKQEIGPNASIELQKSLWAKVLTENVYIICKTPMAKSITERTLAGFTEMRVNAYACEDLINRLKNKPDAFISQITKKSFWKNDKQGDTEMKFDAVVGNPPYQLETGSTSRQATPVFNLFVENAKKLKPNFISMIMPSRWFAGGMGLDKFRESMMTDKKIQTIIDFVNAKDCFPQISISGGVCYFLWNKDHNGDCEFINITNGKKTSFSRPLNEFPVLVRYNEAVGIVRKILNKKEQCFDTIISPLMPYGLSTNYRGKNKKQSDDNLTIYSSDGISYVSRSEITKGIETIDKYKVLMSKTSAEHAGEPSMDGTFRVLTSSMKVIGPKEICTHSYFTIGCFDTKEPAEFVLSYLKTRFVRFLILLSLSAINLSKLVFSFVPLQDFTASSDIDWSKTVSEIDKQLYKKYGLTKEEIAFVESKVKGMES